MTTTYDEIRTRLADHGQGHVLQHWDELNPPQREDLLADCARIDFAWLAARLEQLQTAGPGSGGALELAPAPVVPLPSTHDERSVAAEAAEVGAAALRAGRVGAFLVAGGQGTRLGFDGPKGCYAVGPVTQRSLFQWHAEQILASGRRYGVRIPWYIMTSRANDAATRTHFEQADHHGLDPADVMFFQQAVVPSLSLDGKLLLEQPHRLAMNPDGHGGSLAALVRSGAVADMRRRGIDTISYFQVDNPLVTVCDPLFLGHHLRRGAQMSTKVVRKAGPDEKVGVVCHQGGHTAVVEYSDLDAQSQQARGLDGELKYWAGNIAVHLLGLDFVERVGGQAQLPWHVARKAIACMVDGRQQQPSEPNGVKFETFVFDALPLASSSVTLEALRADEFAPVKNRDGADSPSTCRQLLSDRFARWLEELGCSVPWDSKGRTTARIEISPLLALDAAELARRRPVDLPTALQPGQRLALSPTAELTAPTSLRPGGAR